MNGPNTNKARIDELEKSHAAAVEECQRWQAEAVQAQATISQLEKAHVAVEVGDILQVRDTFTESAGDVKIVRIRAIANERCDVIDIDNGDQFVVHPSKLKVVDVKRQVAAAIRDNPGEVVDEIVKFFAPPDPPVLDETDIDGSLQQLHIMMSKTAQVDSELDDVRERFGVAQHRASMFKIGLQKLKYRLEFL